MLKDSRIVKKMNDNFSILYLLYDSFGAISKKVDYLLAYYKIKVQDKYLHILRSFFLQEEPKRKGFKRGRVDISAFIIDPIDENNCKITFIHKEQFKSGALNSALKHKQQTLNHLLSFLS